MSRNGGYGQKSRIKFMKPVSGINRRTWRKLPGDQREKIAKEKQSRREGESGFKRFLGRLKSMKKSRLIAMVSLSVLLLLILGAGIAGMIYKITDDSKTDGDGNPQIEDDSSKFEFMANRDTWIVKGFKSDVSLPSGSYTVPSSYEGKPVTEIAEEAFKDKHFIKEITLPDSILKIGKAAFKSCDELERITLPFIGASGDYKRSDGRSQPAACFYYIFGDSNADIPDSLRTVTTGGDIPAFAFSLDNAGKNPNANVGIETVNLLYGTEAIREQGLSLPKLKYVTFAKDSRLDIIEASAFSGSGIESMTFTGNRLLNVHADAFIDAEKIKYLTFETLKESDAKDKWYTQSFRELYRYIDFRWTI